MLASSRTPPSGGLETPSLDRAALRRAYDEHGSMIHTYALRRLGDPQAAQDVTQEVFVAAWRARDRFDPSRGEMGAWLMGIAKNKLIDHFRSGSRRPELTSVDLEPTDHEPAVDRVADRLLVAKALAELPARRREVIELAFHHDLTHTEIADRTGLPLGTVKSDVRRGLAQIRRMLEGGDDV